MPDEPCVGDDIYCDWILSGKLPVDVVAATDEVLAFHHSRLFWPVQLVIIPRQHTPSLVDLGAGGEELIAQNSRRREEARGTGHARTRRLRVLTNLGNYQDSKHLHFHICCGDPLRDV